MITTPYSRVLREAPLAPIIGGPCGLVAEDREVLDQLVERGPAPIVSAPNFGGAVLLAQDILNYLPA